VVLLPQRGHLGDVGGAHVAERRGGGVAELGLEPQAVSAAVGERQRNELFTAYFLMERRVPHEPEEHADRSMTAPAAPQAELGGTSPRGQIGTVDEGAAVGASA